MAFRRKLNLFLTLLFALKSSKLIKIVQKVLIKQYLIDRFFICASM